jgi:hypothetical protein
MKRVIFSLYIDIPEGELDAQPPYPNDDIPKTYRTKEVLKLNHYFLKKKHIEYADKIGVDYKLFEYDSEYKEYKNYFKKKYPFITTYNIINFYKIQKLYDLAEQYDEILYLDFDVVPVTALNFFESIDFSRGIAISDNFESREYSDRKNFTLDYLIRKSVIMNEQGQVPSNRSPNAKYWNTLALNYINFGSTSSRSYNTGIIGCTSDQLDELSYWENFDNVIEQMKELIEDEFFPDHIRKCFGYDNETIWGHKVELNNVKTQELYKNWHFRMWKQNDIPDYVNFIHVIDKNFDKVKQWLIDREKINL